MRIRTIVPWVALLGIVAILGSRAVSQESGGGPGMKMDPEMVKAMEACAKYGEPGVNHRHLDVMVGKWNTEMKMFMGGPGTEPMISRGTNENKWVLGGRYMQSDYKAEMEMPDPADPTKMLKMPFEGSGLVGYNNFRNVFVGTWVDNMGTQLLTYKGTRNPQTGEFVYYGEMDEAYVPGIGPVVGRYVRYVTKVVSPDKHVMSCYDLHAGENYKVFEITYTRQK